MEKTGNILTQLALISDLFERANMRTSNPVITLMVDQKEFTRLFKLFSKKANSKLEIINETFTVRIGMVKYLFTLNTSNV